MRKPTVKVLRISPGHQQFDLCCLAIAFLLGMALGLQIMIRVGTETQFLGDYLQRYLSQVQFSQLNQPSVWLVTWTLLRWSILTFLMGFTLLGVLGIPILFFLRGGLLVLAVSAFVQIYGSVGALLAFASFGLTALLELPVLFLLGVRGLSSARRLWEKGTGLYPPGKGEVLMFGLCFGTLAGCVLLEYIVVPPLIQGISQLLLR